MDEAAPRLSFADRARTFARLCWRGVIDQVLPPLCLACKQPVADADALCSLCWGGMQFIERPYCERLCIPFGFDLGPGALSAEAIANPPVFNRARAAVVFGGTARSLIHALKYRDQIELSRYLGRHMARAGADILSDADVLVPVPLHRWRLFTRKFNQSAILAQVIGRATGIKVELMALERIRATLPQVGLSGNERRENVRGAFRVNEAGRSRIAGKRVVLIDDALTTGATISAATRALKRAGAANIDVLTFARATLSASIGK
jgi:ComF family protein